VTIENRSSEPGDLCYRIDLGRRDYREIWDLQQKLVEYRRAGRIRDVLLFVEHPPTYTLGRAGKLEHLLVDEGELERIGASFVPTDRGGDITFHGPGQIVGYPILRLGELERDVYHYLRRVEDVILCALARFGIEARRVEGLTGVWHLRGKVAAIGVRVAEWVTSHGFALNVSTDLGYFNRIVPCGIVGKSVTSMESILGEPVSMDPVRDTLSAEFGRVFDRDIVAISESSLLQEAHVQVG
jgi:lipoate-protein ligase B